jgi:gamma-glutamyltranspeptidase/glutathione hydrolase
MGTRGMVASAHPLASLAGLRLLMDGGNAVDAAFAVSAALNVAEPFMSGLGGFGAMLIREPSGAIHNLDYLGAWPAAMNREQLDRSAVDVGPRATAVPAAARAWLTAHERFGRKSAGTVLTPAIEYAEGGAGLTAFGHELFGVGARRLNEPGAATFLVNSEVPSAGTIIRQPNLAQTFRTLADAGPDIFYRGRIAEQIVEWTQRAGGFLTMEDLANYEPRWVEPVTSTYRGYDLLGAGWPSSTYEIMLTLNILEGFDVAGSGHNTPQAAHRFLEALKLSMIDRIVYNGLAQPPPVGLLSKEYAASRRELIDPEHARPIEGDVYARPRPQSAVEPGNPRVFSRECTTHFDVIDADGMAVSVTQSLGGIFGSGFMCGDTGVLLNNYSYFFELDPESPNAIRPDNPGSGPLSPVMILQSGRLLAQIGTPGAYGIPQTTAQMISNLLDHEFSVQAAIEAPRFRLSGGLGVMVEDRIPDETLAELARRGHDLQRIGAWSMGVGGGQGILIDPATGIYNGGADPRRDGYALGW